MSRYLRTYSGARAITNKSNESNEYERTRIKVRSFVANGYSLRIVSCSEDSFDIRPCSLIIYSNGLKFGRFVRCPSLVIPPQPNPLDPPRLLSSTDSNTVFELYCIYYFSLISTALAHLSSFNCICRFPM